jgi:IPT/TIG domain.
MAQSALTVTPPNPTPPTNMSCTGATPPNPPNFTKNTYADAADNNIFNTYPPPYFDDGTAGSLTAFATNTAALASGTGATAGGTEGSYPGAANGVVPASTSVAHEGAGTEVVVTLTYPAAYVGAQPHYPLVTDSTGPLITTQVQRDAGPNASHPSTMSPATNPALASITPTTAVSAASGTQLITCTGTNFTPGCRIWVDNVERTTTYVSATSLTTTVPKKSTAAPGW